MQLPPPQIIGNHRLPPGAEFDYAQHQTYDAPYPLPPPPVAKTPFKKLEFPSQQGQEALLTERAAGRKRGASPSIPAEQSPAEMGGQESASAAATPMNDRKVEHVLTAPAASPNTLGAYTKKLLDDADQSAGFKSPLGRTKGATSNGADYMPSTPAHNLAAATTQTTPSLNGPSAAAQGDPPASLAAHETSAAKKGGGDPAQPHTSAAKPPAGRPVPPLPLPIPEVRCQPVHRQKE